MKGRFQDVESAVRKPEGDREKKRKGRKKSEVEMVSSNIKAGA